MATEIIIVATGDIFNFSYNTSTTESPPSGKTLAFAEKIMYYKYISMLTEKQ